MKIAVLIDAEAVPVDDPQLTGLSPEIHHEMEFHIAEALRINGHKVEVIPFGPDIMETIGRLLDAKPDLVFNLTEHFGGDRRMDKNIVALLDLLHLPYTGSGPTALMLCRDKATCKRILSHHHVRVPRFAAIPVGRTSPPRNLNYPLVVKPVYEDGSDGISIASLVHNEKEAAERIRMLHERMNQPAICEEYVDGRELYVGIIGNRRLQTFPARELHFGRTGEGAPLIATARVKRDEQYRRKWQISYRHAGLPPEIEKKVARVSKRIYRLLRIRDYGRVDLRLTADNEVVFLEANPNPDLSYGEDLAEAAQRVGIEHVQLVRRIVHLAWRRYHPRRYSSK